MKRFAVSFLSLLLAVMLLSCAFAEATYPEYLNLESDEPIVKDEYKDDVKVKLLLVQSNIGGEWDTVWLSKYLSLRYNLEFEVESVLDTALNEKKSLMFASGDLPDMMWGIGLSTSEIVKYGMQEQLLYPVDTLASEELCPNLYAYLQREDVLKSSQTPDGHVYTLPMIVDSNDEGSYGRQFMNAKLVREMGYELPKTLDELNEILYAFKALDPENNVPIGQSMDAGNNANYIANAFGYTSQYSLAYGMYPALRNGKVVIPAYDMDGFKGYLTQMHQYYVDGIINSNYFTMENTEAIAQLSAGQNILYGEPVYVTGLATWDEWEAPYPLTSEYNDVQQWSKPNFVQVGGCAISADTDKAELCLRICDLFYSEDSRILWAGPGNDSEWALGYYCAELSDAGTETYDTAKLPDGVDLWTYLMQDYAGFMASFGAQNDLPAMAKSVERLGGTYEKGFDMTNADQHYRWSVYNNLSLIHI